MKVEKDIINQTGRIETSTIPNLSQLISTIPNLSQRTTVPALDQELIDLIFSDPKNPVQHNANEIDLKDDPMVQLNTVTSRTIEKEEK